MKILDMSRKDNIKDLCLDLYVVLLGTFHYQGYNLLTKCHGIIFLATADNWLLHNIFSFIVL